MERTSTMTDLTLDRLDADGALRETAAEAATDTRAGLLARAGLIGGGAFGLGALVEAGTAAAATSPRDIAILNFALTLEYLEAAFYAEALRKGALRGERRVFARVAGRHERSHVAVLQGALGRRAVKRPRFDFQGTTESSAAFTKTSIALEQTGIGAYKGQAPRIQSTQILAVALSIHSVEARHTGWIRDIAGLNPAPDGLDAPLTRAQTLARVAATGFIVPARRPRFTG
jgi:Ferritin-like domain